MVDAERPRPGLVVRNEQREDNPLKVLNDWLAEPEGHPKPDPRYPQLPDYWAR